MEQRNALNNFFKKRRDILLCLSTLNTTLLPVLLFQAFQFSFQFPGKDIRTKTLRLYMFFLFSGFEVFFSKKKKKRTNG